MHALSRLVQQRMDALGYSRSDLARRAGVSKATVTELLSDQRDTLDGMPAKSTVAGLATALHIPTEQLLLAAAEAYGVPVDAPVLVPTVDGVSSTDLARELARRVEIDEAVARDSINPLDILGASLRVVDVVDVRAELLRHAQDQSGKAPIYEYLADVLTVAIERADNESTD